jgi:hypothetical protein
MGSQALEMRSVGGARAERGRENIMGTSLYMTERAPVAC